jgi:DNA-directed RNA polymerase specialized sigma24 family protein
MSALPATVTPAKEVASREWLHASREWLHSLRAEGGTRNEAVERLHALLPRAARFEAARPRVMADRLDTTQGALYKTLHGARRKLREQLEPRHLQ